MLCRVVFRITLVVLEAHYIGCYMMKILFEWREKQTGELAVGTWIEHLVCLCTCLAFAIGHHSWLSTVLCL